LEFKRVLAPDGAYVLIGGGGPDAGNWIGPLAGPIKTMLLSPFVHQKFVMLLADVTRQDLTALIDLIRAGKVTPVIDRTYPLSEAPAALRYLEEGHARGKVVISMD
jgi:NADPH:quinone reductase-like Zn-dependent oxidoreductase